MKRIVSLLIAMSMVLSVFASVFAAAQYSDLVGDNLKYAGAVAALSELKVDGQAVIQGYPDGTFGPEKPVTRAELAKMLVVCNGIGDVAAASKMIFSDVPTTHWAAAWVNTAAQSKIIVGYPDGSFGPEKTVTYAEAFTMALRALGYGNVADFEGVWPTAYVQKATELTLNRDMEYSNYSAAATRGNVAILLWNMLRTPMWKVTEESENSGMTLSNQNGQRMLNVKFPDYAYVEGVFIRDLAVTDNDDVRIELEDEEGQALGGAQIRGVDLSRIVRGMKITALVKDGKKDEEPTYLTLTPENTMVEGVITKVEDNKFTVNGVEYKYDANKAQMPDGMIAVNNYVAFEVDGKKVVVHNNNFVIAALTVGGKEAEDLKAVLREIKEDSVVIKDGEWIDREDIAEGDIYTKVEGFGNPFWMVASVNDRISGSFDSYRSETEDGVKSYFVKVDGEEYRNILGNEMKAYEGEKNNKSVKLADLQAKEKENKYLDQEVEVAFDYLGNPVKLLFGEVSDLNNGGSFYAVANGVWKKDDKGGQVRKIALVGFDGEGASKDAVSDGVDYEIKKNANVEDALGQDEILAAGVPQFVWANFDDAGETIKTLLPLSEALKKSGDPEEYKGKYTILAVGGEKVDNGKVADYRVSASTPVMVVTPLKDDDDVVEGYAIEVKQGLEDGDELPAGSFLAYDSSKTVKKAVYVFLAEEAESKIWSFARVDKYDEENDRGINYVTLNGQRYELSDESPKTDFTKGDIVAYTVYKEKAKVHAVFTTADLDGAHVIDEETESEVMVFTNGDQFDLDEDSDDVKDYKNYKVVDVEVGTKDDNETLTFESCEENSGKGLLAVTNEEGIRVIFGDDEHKYLLVFHGLKFEEFTKAGALVEGEEGHKPGEDVPQIKEENEGETSGEGEDKPTTYTVTYEWSGEAPEGATLPENHTVEAGASWTHGTVTYEGNDYTFAYDPETAEAVDAGFTCYVTATATEGGDDDEEEPFWVAYEWVGFPDEDLADLPSGEEVPFGGTWTSGELAGILADYDDADHEITVNPEEATEATTVTITRTEVGQGGTTDGFAVSYAWAAGVPAAIQGAVRLPSGTNVPSGEEYEVEVIAPYTVTSGDTELVEAGFESGDVIEFETDPEGVITVTNAVEIEVDYLF